MLLLLMFSHRVGTHAAVAVAVEAPVDAALLVVLDNGGRRRGVFRIVLNGGLVALRRCLHHESLWARGRCRRKGGVVGVIGVAAVGV